MFPGEENMNTLCHIGAFVATLWFAIQAFNGDLIPTFADTRPLGFALLALDMLWLVLIIVAVGDDARIITGRRNHDDDS